jgi:hypothetical protein
VTRQTKWTFTPSKTQIGDGAQVLIALGRVKHRTPARRKPVPLDAQGAKVIAKDDYLPLPKRPYTVLIPYESQGGERLWGRFGGLTLAAAEALASSHDAHIWKSADLDDMLDTYKGWRVVEWPSELVRLNPYDTSQVQGEPDAPWQNIEVP